MQHTPTYSRAQTKTKLNPNQTQTKPKPNPNQTQTKPKLNPNYTLHPNVTLHPYTLNLIRNPVFETCNTELLPHVVMNLGIRHLLSGFWFRISNFESRV